MDLVSKTQIRKVTEEDADVNLWASFACTQIYICTFTSECIYIRGPSWSRSLAMCFFMVCTVFQMILFPHRKTHTHVNNFLLGNWVLPGAGKSSVILELHSGFYWKPEERIENVLFSSEIKGHRNLCPEVSRSLYYSVIQYVYVVARVLLWWWEAVNNGQISGLI